MHFVATKIKTGFGEGLLHLSHINIVKEQWAIMQYLEQVYNHLHTSITLSRNKHISVTTWTYLKYCTLLPHWVSRCKQTANSTGA